MKKFVLSLIVASMALSMSAVDLKTGSFYDAAFISRVGIVFDYSDTVIDGMSIEEFRKSGRVDEDYAEWDEFDTFIRRRFMAGLNDRKMPNDLIFRLGPIDGEYQIKVSPLLMDSDGNYNVLLSFIAPDGTVKGTAYESGDGGIFGSFSNLQGDAFEELGEHFARFLYKQIRRATKIRSGASGL